MKKIIFTCFCFLIFICDYNALEINSKSLYAMDMDSGRVFYEKNSDEKKLIASTTKIMTAIIALENSDLTDLYEAGEEVLKAYGSNVYLEYKEHMLNMDLLYGLMMRSGNDCAIVLANHVTNYDYFVELMNKKVSSLNLKDSFFSNPTGLDDEDENVSTAHDLAYIYRYAYQNDVFKTIVGTKDYRVTTDKKSYVWHNRNTLLSSYEYATGGKTGYTPKAGRVLVTSAARDDLNIVVASFNSVYDYNLHQQIYENIFDNYEKVLLLDKDNFYVENDYDGSIYINSSFSYPLTDNEKTLIKKNVVFTNDKPNDGDMIGTIYIYLDDDIINSTDIYFNKKKIGLFDRVKNFFAKLF